MDINLSEDQSLILKRLDGWYKSDYQYVTLGGFAGTGKTTLISVYRNNLYDLDEKLKVAFCAYTGKATRVLKDKLKEMNALYEDDSVSTIHSLIYSPLKNNAEQIIGWELQDKIDADVIIVDEASMVDEMIWKDLLSFRKRILAVGDHGQLPPIKGSFNLMDNPMLKLEQIHRQAKDNPIIAMSIQARTNGAIDFNDSDLRAIKIAKDSVESRDLVEDKLALPSGELLMLCGYNNTRVKLNQYAREFKEIHANKPVPGDRVICLRNNHAKEIFNGMLGSVESIFEEDEETYLANISLDGEAFPYRGLIAREQFGSTEKINIYEIAKSKIEDVDLFDYGYALTVHKAQGSQAPHVVLFEERFKNSSEEDWRRWLYTAITRAEETVTIIG